MNLLKEVKEQAIDYLKDNQDIETYGCDLHHEIFNTDYFLGLHKNKYLSVYNFALVKNKNLESVGKFHIEVCTTTPCMLRGSDPMLDLCKKKFGLEIVGITEDGLFSL